MQAQTTSELAWLAEPIAADDACGAGLDGSPLLVQLDAQRVFGLLTAPGAEPDWRTIQSRAVSALRTSRDFRALAHLVVAQLHTGPLIEALPLFGLIHTWLERYWDEVHPRLDGDALERRNVLNCFADRVAIVDVLRRLPLLSHGQLGTFSLRDIDIAMGLQPNPDPDREPRSAQEVEAALAASERTSVIQLRNAASEAQNALLAAQEIMRTRAGESAIPQFDALVAQLGRIQKVLNVRTDDVDADEGQSTSATGDTTAPLAPGATGSIRSRYDAVRALEAVAEYFRRHEPSSPVALLVERAKRVVSMDFLAVLAELAPDALEQARRATGAQGSKDAEERA
jgi:type VI secretion system protein ImpA